MWGGFAEHISSAHALGNNNVIEGNGMSAETPKAGDEPPPTGSPGGVPGANLDAKVFVSYASRDVAVADAVVAALERHGVGCWIAPRDVKGGALYADAIVRSISDA